MAKKRPSKPKQIDYKSELQKNQKENDSLKSKLDSALDKNKLQKGVIDKLESRVKKTEADLIDEKSMRVDAQNESASLRASDKIKSIEIDQLRVDNLTLISKLEDLKLKLVRRTTLILVSGALGFILGAVIYYNL